MESRCSSPTDAKDMEWYTMFTTSDQHSSAADPWRFGAADAVKSGSSLTEDPLDVLFTPPVRHFLECDDKPDKSTSSAPDSPKDRSYDSLPSRDDSLFLAQLDKPDKSTSSTPDIPTGRSFVSLRDDSLFLEQLVLSSNCDDYDYEFQPFINREGPPDETNCLGCGVGKSSFAPIVPKARRLSFREDSLLLAQRFLFSKYDEDYEPQKLSFIEPQHLSDAPSDDSASSLPAMEPMEQDPVIDNQDTEEIKDSCIPSRQSTLRTSSKLKKKPKSVSPWTEDDLPIDQEVTDIQDIDVLFGKGGKINKHVGNLRYHKEKKSLQEEYLHEKTTKSRKRELVQQLYNIVVQDWGGRFLCRNQGNEEKWFQAQHHATLEKCRQALATPERSAEERATRRRMFLEKKKKKTPPSKKGKAGAKK